MKRRPCIWSSSKSPSPSKSAARRGIGCAARSPQAPAETRSTPVDGAAHRGLRGAGSRPGAWRPWCRFSSTALLLEVAQPCRRPAAQERMRGRGAVCLHVLEPAIVREPPITVGARVASPPSPPTSRRSVAGLEGVRRKGWWPPASVASSASSRTCAGGPHP